MPFTVTCTPCAPGDRRLERVGGAETVVVVPVEVEMAVGKRRDDAADELADLRRRQQAERVGQHDALSPASR